mmetsp:Transcript_87345/g.247896  ORF Transcript_87345/g.247896 Transcript_87345/m.247896 type:complete len:257 (+) Transcript_87345:118-888(+)
MATSALSRPGNVYRDGRCRCRPSSALHLATSQATSFLSTLLPRLPRAGGVDHRALLVRRGVVVRAVTTDGLRRRHAQLLQAREHGGRHGGVGLVTVRQEVNGLLGVVADVVQAARVRRADLAVIVRTERRVSRARVLGCHHRDGRNYRLGGGGGGTVQCDGAVVAGEAVVELVRPRREGGAACRVVGILQVNVPARGVPESSGVGSSRGSSPPLSVWKRMRVFSHRPASLSSSVTFLIPSSSRVTSALKLRRFSSV